MGGDPPGEVVVINAIRGIFPGCCASTVRGTRMKLTATASPISRMRHLGGGRLAGSLAERHEAHQRPGLVASGARVLPLAGDVAEERHGQGSRASTRYSMTWSARPSTDGGIVRPS